MNMNPRTGRRAFAAFLALTLCVGGSLYGYHNFLRKVRLAFVGYPDVAWAAFEEAARQTPYAVRRLDRTALAEADLGSYTGVLIWGMGLNLSPVEVAALERSDEQGTKILVTGPTPAGAARHTNVDDRQRADIAAYLEHGGGENLVALLHYVAHAWAGRAVAVPPLVKTPRSGYFYLGGSLFDTRESFEREVAQRGPALPADAPRVALIAALLNPREPFHRGPLDALIHSFQRQGIRVYPLFGRDETPRLLQEVQPDLVVTLPHGRLAADNALPPLLAELDVPVLTGLSLGTSVAEWEQSERGMDGGRLSQSVTMPELDGAIEPFTLVSDELNDRSLRVPQAIEERIERFTRRAARWLALRRKPNADKRVVIVYYKAPGLASLSAAGLEVGPSLWNLLRRLEQEGYDLGGALPDSPEALFDLIQQKGKTLGQWALGSYEEFLAAAEPEFVPATQYLQWLQRDLSEKRRQEIVQLWGPPPGKAMAAERDGQPCLVVSRIRLGNVVLMPQPTVGAEDADPVQSIHGTDKAPPHFYLAAYLWARHGFQADAILHFGTHGSLEFTRGKSAALSQDCWPDTLIGDLPHIYPYISNNIGEALVAKRRSYAVTVSHLTPPFMAAGLYGDLLTLHDKLQEFSASEDPELRLETRRSITQLAGQLDLGSELGVHLSDSGNLLTDEQLEHLEDYMHQLQAQNVTDGLHVLGRPWTEEQIRNTVTLMLGEPGCDAILAATARAAQPEFMAGRRALARTLVDGVLDGRLAAATLFGAATPAAPQGGGAGPATADPSAAAWDPAAFWDHVAASGLTTDDHQKQALLSVLDDIQRFADHLRQSPQLELDAIVRALGGGYVPPSSGGDPLINPESVPTGRNLYGFNPEAAPTEEAWRIGCRVADEIIAQHRAATGQWPRQVAVTLWGGEFVRDKGTTVAEVLYLLGVRPRRNARGSVYDIEIIPSDELGRPRIDVLVQTSGQFRDAAASRILLLDKAVQLVSALSDETHPNFVREGSQEAEAALKERGLAPQDARELSTARVFGAAGNQSYGTGIMGLVEKGDTWQDETDVADRYVRNMGGIYREGAWGTYREGVLEAQLAGVDAVLHSRSSNTWGPLSLDHVYEFMGGMTLSVRARTGTDPRGYFSDLRTRQRAQATTAVAAIREEARTTLWNPRFLSGLQREGPAAAATLAETVRNLYGWNVMQPSAIDEELWNETFSVLVEDRYALGLRQFFETRNPYALEDLTAVMLETVRKGYWQPPEQVRQQLARMHAEVVARYGAACSYETCGNKLLQQFIAGQLNAPGAQVSPAISTAYQAALDAALTSPQPRADVAGIELEESLQRTGDAPPPAQPGSTVALACGLVLFVLATLAAGAQFEYQGVRRRRSRWQRIGH